MSTQRSNGLGEWTSFVLAAVAIAAGSIIATGQITVPNTFINGTVADATQVNANFNALATNALNRTGGTMTGTLNSRDITPTADATYSLGTGAFRFNELRAVTLFGAGSNITALNGSNISSGTVASARGGVGIDASAPTDGQLLIGKTSDGSWNKATVTAGTGISVTNAGGSITVANAATSAYTFISKAVGTTVSTPGTVIFTKAFSAGDLTAADELEVHASFTDTTGNCGAATVENSTDGVVMATLSGVNVSRALSTRSFGIDGTTLTSVVGTGLNGGTASTLSPAFVANWTGAWTMVVKIGAAGDSATNCNYQIRLRKLAGQ